MVCSFIGENKEFQRQFLSGELEVELVPQVRFIFWTKINPILLRIKLN